MGRTPKNTPSLARPPKRKSTHKEANNWDAMPISGSVEFDTMLLSFLCHCLAELKRLATADFTQGMEPVTQDPYVLGLWRAFVPKLMATKHKVYGGERPELNIDLVESSCGPWIAVKARQFEGLLDASPEARAFDIHKGSTIFTMAALFWENTLTASSAGAPGP